MHTWPEQPFVAAAQQQGFAPAAAQAAFAAIAAQLRARGHMLPTLRYIYRTGRQDSLPASTPDNRPATQPFSRPRTLLAFTTADTALAFAQRHGLRPTPRLARLSLATLLVVLLERPAFPVLLLADEPLLLAGQPALPVGLRVERAWVLTLLQGDRDDGEPF